jgi:hypothetical protein
MQMKWVSVSTACQTERRDLPWRKKCEWVTHSATVHKQWWLKQMSTHRYRKIRKITVFQKCK